MHASPRVLIEHNVIRGGSWPVRGLDGELRYNLVLDNGGHGYVSAPADGARIDHNIFVETRYQYPYRDEQIFLLYNSRGVKVWANTFDGGGNALAWRDAVIHVAFGSILGSLRANVFTNDSDGSPLLATPAYDPTPTQIDRLAYADYNDVWNPLAPNRPLYGLGVVGRRLGQPGFGGHDLGGANGQANPRFAGHLHLPYPVDEAAVWNGQLTVLDVLRRYRATYTPGPGSPLTDAGDPQDGPGADIGAIGSGMTDPDDRFAMP
jgi:hypothetical protein